MIRNMLMHYADNMLMHCHDNLMIDYNDNHDPIRSLACVWEHVVVSPFVIFCELGQRSV